MRVRSVVSRLGIPGVLAVALTATVVLALVIAGATSTAAFGTYNPTWEGTSELRTIADEQDADHEIVRDAARYDEVAGEGTVAVVIAPEREYDAADAARVERFVRRGGTLVVMDASNGSANALLDDIGADARLDGRLLRDERHHYRSPSMPVATNVSDHPLVADVDELTLNYGTAVQPDGATPIVNSSPYAYLTDEPDDELERDQELDAYPVVTVERIGDGRMIVVSDPSAFINAMLDRPGNRAFAQALFRTHDRALLDYSHAADLPPLAVAVLVVREFPPLQLLLAGLGLACLGAWARSPGALERLRDRLTGRSAPAAEHVDPDGTVAVVARRHPEWDAERLRRVLETSTVIRTEEKRDGNDD